MSNYGKKTVTKNVSCKKKKDFVLKILLNRDPQKKEFLEYFKASTETQTSTSKIFATFKEQYLIFLPVLWDSKKKSRAKKRFISVGEILCKHIFI